jgi:long-chain acyl-CoA synthetase
MLRFLQGRKLRSFEQSSGTYTYRTKDPDGKLMSFPFGRDQNTVHRVLQLCFKKYTNLPCVGTRKYIKMHQPEGARFPLKVFGDTSWKTYGQVREEAAAFGAGLRALGLEPLPLTTAQDMVLSFGSIGGPHAMVLFEETSAEWTTACIGAMGQSIPVATSYATLGMGAVAEALNQTCAPVIVCNYKDVARVAKECGSQCPNLRTIVYTRLCVEEQAPEHPNMMGDLQVLSMAAVMDLGRRNPIGYAEPTPEHVGLIMYTSGSTGKPKGVMLKNSSIVASMAGLEDYFCSSVGNRATNEFDQETYLAYLPAAHILEFAAEMSMLVHGAKIGYSDPKTIGSTGAFRLMPDGSLNSKPTGYGNRPPGGIQEFAPTVMAAVPKIWDILKKGVEDSIGKSGGVMRTIFQAAFSARSAALQQGRETPLLGLLFKKVGGALGGRVKAAVTGGGPISADVQNFIRVAMHFNLVQGYALTETCSAGTLQPSDSMLDGIAGRPVASVQMRLNDCGEIDPATRAYKFVDREKKPYLSTDTKHLGTPCLGRGEVWIRGDSVSSGYYLQMEKTREEFDEQGWFHTGDIAIWCLDGQLKIVDRLKNLVKLKGGEYVAIESMEATYAQSVFVNGKNGGMMCYADGDMDKPVALVQVNDYELKKWADENNITYHSIPDLCANPRAAEMVCKDLNAIGKGKLGGNEALAAVALLPGTAAPESKGEDAPWTAENGYLTAANKLARNIVKEGFEKTLKELKPKGIR